jgi:carboxyl-terminal processing protease
MRSSISFTTTILAAFILMSVIAAAGTTSQRPDRAAAALLDRHVAAIGGHEAWSAIETIRTVSEVETFGMKRRSTRIEERSSGRFLTSSSGPEGTLEMGFDGTSVWRRAPWGKGVLPDNDWQGRILRGWRERQIAFWRESGKEFRSASDETIDGRKYHVIETTEPDESEIETLVRYYFDAKTHLLDRTVKGNPGSSLQATTIFSDYRKVGSVRVPHQIVSENPQARSVTRLLEWEANVAIPAGHFRFDAGEPDFSAIPELQGIDLSKARVFRPGDANLPPDVAKMIEQAQKEGATGTTTISRSRTAGDPGGDLADASKLEAFNAVWNTINDTYWDPTFGGRDWKEIGERYRPRVLAASDSKELHEILNEMVNQLGETHFRVLPPEKTRTVGSSRPLPGTVGMSYRGIDGQLVVTKVDVGQPAEAAGILPGFVVHRVNGRLIAELAAELIEREPVLALRPDAAMQRAVAVAIGGDAGEAVEIEFLDRDDVPFATKLTRAARSLGTMNRLEFESRWLEEDRIGYMRISSFFGNAAERVAGAVEEMQNAETIIVDLRGNGGGAGDLAPTIAAMFAREPGTLGVSQLRHGTREFDYAPAAGAFTGELIILVDGGSASTSEVFAGGLQESGRATVIGTTTRGGVLPSLAALLPTGGALQHVISDFRTPKGVVLEGRGVFPDVEVGVSRADLIGNHDPILARALEVATIN